MTIKLGINGFGRIGKMILRAIIKRDLAGSVIEIMGVSDFYSSAKEFLYHLKYDSVYGKLNIESTISRSALSPVDDFFTINGSKVKCIQGGSSPSALPWSQLGVDYVVDTTGRFTSQDMAAGHIKAGAKKVILSSNASSPGIKTMIMGVNHDQYDSLLHNIVSNSSCTANCVTSIIDALMKNKIGIVSGNVLAVIPYTSSRRVVDGFSERGLCDGRSAVMNIIPSSINISKTVDDVFPLLKGRISDIFLRVPSSSSSIIEFSFNSANDTSIEEIDLALKKSSAGYLDGILGVNEEELVSSDFIDDPRSSIYDSYLTLKYNVPGERRFFRIFAWYDNEWGYANRIIDLLLKMNSEDKF